MKKLSLILIALCTCATFYCERDTNRKKEWPRDLEPRLSNASEWNTWHPDAARRTESYQPCIQIDTADDARYALSFWPRCLDKAIAVVKAGAFKAADYGVYSFMKNGGCSLAPLGTFEGKVPAEVMAKVAEKEKAIKVGSLTVEINDEEPKSS